MAKFQSELLKVAYNNQQIILAKPQTYMNLSGNAIASIARFYDILPKDILVIHDEIDFPIAKIMLKYGGSSAGHNGLKSTIEKLGTQDFWRLRIGVGRPQDQRQISNRVLGKFTVAEKTDLQMKA